MATVTVLNPPGRLTRPRLYKRKKRHYRGPKSTLPKHMRLANPKRKRRKRRAAKRRIARRRVSPKSIAALKRYNKSRKNLGRKRKRRVKRRSHRGRRRTRHFNPFGGEIMTLANPTRRRKKSMARRRKRRSHRRRYSNPAIVRGILAKPREMLSQDFAIDAVSTAAGFIVPQMAMNFLPLQFRDSKMKFYLSKTASIVALAAAAGFVSKKASKMFLVGGGASLILDLWTEFRARSVPAPAGDAGTQYYYGDQPGMNYYYGPGLSDSIVLSDEQNGGF